MCAIVGALLHDIKTVRDAQEAEALLTHILLESRARGRDGFGWHTVVKTDEDKYTDTLKFAGRYDPSVVSAPMMEGLRIESMFVVSNLRAEPTTEYVLTKHKEDQQPYSRGPWTIAHNGTIANDKELRDYSVRTAIDSAAIVEALHNEPEQLFNGPMDAYSAFRSTVEKLVGSYAILAGHEQFPEQVLVAANYRPVWYAVTDLGVFFASAKEYFPTWMNPIALEPYSTASFRYELGDLIIQRDTLRPQLEEEEKPRALVVASGGLDSTVAAAQCIKEGYDVQLIHFTYGCRAEDHEVEAIEAIANALGVKLTLFPIDIYSPTDSRLFDKDSNIAGGEEGAEFAHEWVPARNLVMLSVATAYAEANGFEYIVLGNNLEEAGAYPDNEPEFIRRFNELLPFAVGDGKRVKVLMPVGDLMKHEIVALGHANGAPLHLTWSCYKNGDQHCGKCGPCFMRKTAFQINNLPEVIEYEA